MGFSGRHGAQPRPRDSPHAHVHSLENIHKNQIPDQQFMPRSLLSAWVILPACLFIQPAFLLHTKTLP